MMPGRTTCARCGEEKRAEETQLAIVENESRAVCRFGCNAKLCPCGKAQRRCDDCGGWVCSAPGHAKHVHEVSHAA